MKKVFFSLALLFALRAGAQTPASCEVLVDSLKGTYTGECDKGKAHGQGKSVGISTYEGEFKKGYPEGKGTYTWPNGSTYTGSWKKGLQDGYGEMHAVTPGKGESVVKGYWSKGKYKGEYENPYKIFTSSTEIGRVQFSKMREAGSGGMGTLSIQVQDISSSSPLLSAASSSTILRMTSSQITGGTYMSKTSNALTNKEVTLFQGVTFPFRGIFTFGTITIDFEIYEPGDWSVEIPVRK